MALTAMQRATTAVKSAINRGRMVTPKSLGCERCGGGAALYHHHKGYADEYRLDVVPLCVSCHRLIHEEERQGVTRRARDAELLRLLEEGKTLQEAATEVGVTKQYVSERLKALGLNAQAFRARREAARLAAARQMDIEALQQGEKLLTVREAARATGWSRENVQRAITLGLLPAHKLGRQRFVTETAVRHWIETAPHRPGPAPGTPRAPRKPPKQEGQG